MSNIFIEKLNGISQLAPREIKALAEASGSPRRYPAKHDLIREGDQPGEVFVVLEGWICRYKILPKGTRQILAFLMPGDFCDLLAGPLAQMDHSIQTITPASVATIKRAQMDEIIENHRGVATALYLSQLNNESMMRSWIAGMGRRTSMERVAHLLCEMYLRSLNTGSSMTIPLVLPVSQAFLADSVGITLVHLNRVLKDLRISGAVSLHRGNIVIEEPVKLARFAGFDQKYIQRRPGTVE